MPNRLVTVQVSDTRDGDSSNDVGNKKIDWEGLEKEFDDWDITLNERWSPKQDVWDWLKTKLQDYIK